jgi:CRISPR-associated protein Csb2
MGVTIALPRSASVDDRRAVWFACGQLQMRGLHIPGVGDWSLEAVDAMDAKLTLRPVSWANPSKTWQTVTPILLDRFPKRKGPSVEEIIVASCARIGLPVPTMIEHSPYSKIEGVPPVPAFRLVRRESDSARWGVHARIVFECEIRGPVLLGAGRYFGLGLLRPERRKEEGNDAEQ